MSTRAQYSKEMADHFGGYFAAWTPGDPLKLGDFGVLDGKAFTRIGNVEDLGITFAKRLDPTPEVIGPYTSTGKVSVAFKAAGTATIPNSTLAQVDAGFSVQFSCERAVFFLAENCLQPSIADQVKLGRDIISAFKEGKWSKSWRVITQLVETSSMTVLISSGSDGVVDLKANGAIKTSPGATDLAKVNLELQVQFSRNMETQLVAQSGCTPMFKLSAVKKIPFGRPDFRGLTCIKPSVDQIAQLPLAAVTPKYLKDNPAMENYLSFDEVTD